MSFCQLTSFFYKRCKSMRIYMCTHVCQSANSLIYRMLRAECGKGVKKKKWCTSDNLSACLNYLLTGKCWQADGLSNSLIHRILRGIQKINLQKLARCTEKTCMADKLMQSGGYIEGPSTDAGPYAGSSHTHTRTNAEATRTNAEAMERVPRVCELPA